MQWIISNVSNVYYWKLQNELPILQVDVWQTVKSPLNFVEDGACIEQRNGLQSSDDIPGIKKENIDNEQHPQMGIGQGINEKAQYFLICKK